MKKIALLSHSSGISGPIDYLETFLISQNDNVYKIEHPLDQYKSKETILSYNHKITSKYPRVKLILPINIIIDMIFNIIFLISINRTGVIIGANNFDTLTGIIYKKMFRKSKTKVIYFASDYSPNRFSNKFFNQIYLKIETFVLRFADITISNTSRASNQRISLGISSSKSVVLPNGVALDNPNFKQKHIYKDRFIYVGNITKEHGLLNAVDALANIISELVIIGIGDELDDLLTLCKEKSIYYRYLGKKSHTETIKYLQDFQGLGLAPYNKDSDWTYYCSPLKVNEYIACGIPVIISNIPEISDEVKKNKLGIIYNNVQEIPREIKNFSTEDFHLKAKRFYSMYNYSYLFNILYKKL